MIGSVTLATAAVRAAYAALLPEGVQPGIEIIDVLAEHITNRKSRTNFKAVVERSIATISESLTTQFRHEFAQLPDHERQAAIQCVRSTLESGWPDAPELPKALAEPRTLQVELRRQLRRRTQRERLSSAADEFAVRALDTCVTAALALARDIEPVRNRRDWEIWFSVGGITTRLDDLFGDFLEPNIRRGNNDEFLEFDRYFRTAVIEQLRTVHILGLPVDPDLNRQSLDHTMVPITASLVQQPTRRQGNVTRDGQPEGRAVEVLAPPTFQRLDEVVARLNSASHSSRAESGVRLVVVGSAGSGKTTFSQWLAYRLARGQLPSELVPLIGTTPFFIRLRDVMKKGVMPSNEAIVRLSYDGVSPPGGWIKARMQRAWFLIDGLDEVDPSDLDMCLAWIAALQDQHPRANFIITTRPQEELVRPFQARDDFEIWRVDDLTESLAVLAATKWFDALEQRDSQWASNETRDRLVAQLLAPTDLRELATTPLVVAMLCAFYASGRQAGGVGRTELYKDVCSVLVDLREAGSGLVSQDRFYGDADAKLRVIGAIAIATLLSGRQSIRLRPTSLELGRRGSRGTSAANSDAKLGRDMDLPDGSLTAPSLGTALEAVKEELARLSRYKGYNENRALDYLLRRSNVFFAATPFEGEFVHRSIMEHLAAREFVVRDSLTQLLGMIRDRPQLEAVAFVAADLANESQADQLLRHFLVAARSTAKDEARRSRVMACIRVFAGSQVSDQALVDELYQIAMEFLPPRDVRTAELLATLGPQMLPWLSPVAAQPDANVDLDSYEAGLKGVIAVGGDEALPYLADLSRHSDANKFADTYLQAWSRFDVEEYAHHVLRNLDLSGVAVPIRTEQQLDLVAALPSVQQVKILSQVSHGRRHDLSGMGALTTVDLSNNHLVQNLSGLTLPGSCVSLIASETSLESLEGADLSGLKTLWLPRNANLQSINVLGETPNLEVLNLAGSTRIDRSTIDEVSTLAKLTNLNVSGIAIDPSLLAGLSRLRRLELNGSGAASSLRWLTNMTRLRAMSLAIARTCSELNVLASMHELKEVTITNRVSAPVLEAVLRAPKLQKLQIEAADGFESIPAGQPRSVTRLALRSSSLESLAGIGRFPRLRTLDLTDSTDLRTLDGLEPCQDLEVLILNGCRFLQSIDVLARGFRNLRVVNMLDGVPFVDPIAVMQDRIDAGLHLQHDPYDPFGGISS